MQDNVRRVIGAWFDLVDLDGGGSLDSSELLAALKVGVRVCEMKDPDCFSSVVVWCISPWHFTRQDKEALGQRWAPFSLVFIAVYLCRTHCPATNMHYKHATQAAGIPCDDQTILEMIRLMDINSDGEISWVEFENFMCNEFASGKTLLSGEYGACEP